jgi:hypothetical protein
MNDYIQISDWGISNNLINRNKNKDAVITQEDALLNLDAQELIDNAN